MRTPSAHNAAPCVAAHGMMMKPARNWLLALAAGGVLMGVAVIFTMPPEFAVPKPGAIVVTGAASGIGRHVVQRLAKELPEHTIYGIVRREADAAGVTALGGNGDNVRALVADLTDRPSLVAAMRVVADAGRPVVGLFDAAGLPAPNVPVEHLDVDTLRQVYEVDVFGLVNLVQVVLPLMKRACPTCDKAATGSRICFLGSVTGAITPSFMGADAPRAIETIADALRREVRPTGIAVSVIQAGFIQSPIIKKIHIVDQALQESLQANTNIAEMYPGLALKDFEKQMPFEKMGPLTAVSDAVLHAFSATRPQIRYVVGTTPVLPARLLVPLMHVLPHHIIDLLE